MGIAEGVGVTFESFLLALESKPAEKTFFNRQGIAALPGYGISGIFGRRSPEIYSIFIRKSGLIPRSLLRLK
jgi:hypothetical protein